jgi:hypothetical protein
MMDIHKKVRLPALSQPRLDERIELENGSSRIDSFGLFTSARASAFPSKGNKSSQSNGMAYDGKE